MSIYQALAELDERNGAGALCTVVRSMGSTPRRTGSKMLVYPDGKTMGSVGGGELENRVINEASSEELYDICRIRLGDFEILALAF